MTVLDNLIYCLNATVPVFALMLVGMLLRKVGIIDQPFADKISSFVFKVPLPLMLFEDLSQSDFFAVWDGALVLFCFGASLASILISILCSRAIKGQGRGGEFVQGAYRSSIALLGVAFLQSMYGNSGAASLVIIGAVPLYNIAAVVVLAMTSPSQGGVDGKMMKKAAKGIVTNPLIIAIVVGVVWSLLKIPQPAMFQKTVSNLSATATPLGLMALGATFSLKKAMGEWKPTVVGSIFKLVIFAGIFIPIAVAMGFREAKLVSLLTMLAAPTTVSAFVMAKGMGHEGTISTGIVMLTTLLSAFTLTLWLYILRTMGYI